MHFNPTLLSRRVESIPPLRFVAGAMAAIVVVGIIDHLTGPVVSLAILYVVPVAATAWVVGPRPAFAVAVVAATTWAVADRVGPVAEPRADLAYINDASMFALSAVIVAAVGTLRREVHKQRDLMQEVQRHLLPQRIPAVAGAVIAAQWMPLWTVGGDYYDVIDAGPGRVALCLADVSGKGMTAALIMSNVQAIVRTVATDRRHAPDRMLATLNQLLHDRLAGGFFVTAFYAVLDTATGMLSFANAGHPPAMLRRKDGTVEPLASTGPVAGLLPGATYRCIDVHFNEGDQLVIYSDGVTEYENRAGLQFGESRLGQLLTVSTVTSAEETCSTIATALHEFGEGRAFNDDVTMLVAVRTSRPSTLSTGDNDG
jgi:serine phosphatase RsbU (regulator of sigma subunit)